MTHLYHLKGLRFSYGEKPLIGIDEQGFAATCTLSALVGGNGAGKSTLLQLLAFLGRPAAGTIHFAGDEVHDGNRAAYREQVGLVPQNPYLLRGSVRYNVELGLRFRNVPPAARARQSRGIMELLNLAAAERSVRGLSGGEGQKVALGRVLVLEPKVLLLDEPFTWLDAEFVEEFSSLMRYLCYEKGTTIIYTTHDMARAQVFADHIHELRKGNLERLK